MEKKIGLIGEKIGMTQIFDDAGNVIPVTVIQAGPCVVVDIKTVERDGYNAIKLAYKEVEKTKLNRPKLGLFSKNNLKPHKYLREFKIDNPDDFKIGDILSVEQFGPNDFVDVTGITKGKGFQGVVKRWNFKGGPKTRGQSNKWRAPGSIGGATFPARVWKGKKMPGRMGYKRKTVQNLKVVSVEKEKNIILIKGSIPGHNKSIVVIKKAVKKKG